MFCPAGEKQQSATVTGVSEEHVDETSQSRSNNTDHQGYLHD